MIWYYLWPSQMSEPRHLSDLVSESLKNRGSEMSAKVMRSNAKEKADTSAMLEMCTQL